MPKNILITFAGRENRMAILNSYVQKALKNSIIDEWHVWDFTRNSSDRTYIRNNYGSIRYMEAGAEYQKYSKLHKNSSVHFKAKISNDLHLAVFVGNNCFIEFVAGGWKNTRSVIRVIDQTLLTTQERLNPACLYSEETPSLLWSTELDNTISLAIDDKGALQVSVNDYAFPSVPLPEMSDGYEFHIRGGWGAGLEFPQINTRIQQYIGNFGESFPYFHAYQFYASRYNHYRDDVFLKCDDDIVYMDLKNLGNFIEFRRKNKDYFIISANVLNNGVCAHLQQTGRSIPFEIGNFESPPNGLCGTLWESGEKAERLHHFFLQKTSKNLPLPTPIVEWTDRNSINFISWRGEDLRYMLFPRIDDEHALTVAIPRYTKRKTAIYSDFVVSHLSFGPQDHTMDTDYLLEKYQNLMEEELTSIPLSYVA